ncbi:sensor domain-containing diguanylate cyclase [Aliivibrio sifiae]|uniref:diguanylate cyclase n=2 Tax=Aliivibrio sifiae TaxID=566293 RepID=A0A2S7XHQ6_9GAMM|nr:sensor domain-containing diguanylate cyclase [Aliivibrio sifiae]
MFKSNYFYVITSFLLALSLGLLSMRFVYLSDLDNNQKNFYKEADRQSALLSLLIEKDVDFIGAGANFYQVSNKKDWAQFPLFAGSLLLRTNSLVSLQWMEKVEKRDIKNHLIDINKNYPLAKLYTVPEDRAKTYGYVMSKNEPIYIATDIFPRDSKNIPLIGFYSSRERFQRVVSEFLKTGHPSVSDKVRLLQDSLIDRNSQKTGMLVYHPVFTADKKSLKGVMVGVIRITSYFERLVDTTSLGEELVVRIIDTGFDTEDDPVMYESTTWDDFNGIDYTTSINIEDRIWKVEYKTNNTLTEYQRLTLIWMFFGVFTISALIATLTSIVTRDRRRIENLLEIRTKELHYMAMHDDLSGLLNRRAIRDVMNRYIAENTPFGLVCFDIDEFKQINDSYGHPEGDEVLCHISQLVTDMLGDSAHISRLGGDEFSIVIKNKNIEELTKISNEIHVLVAESPTQFDGFEINQTISLGASVWKGETLEELLKATDQALYKSKAMGRNQVTIAE